MPFIDRNHVIQALAPNASNDPFNVTILPRTSSGDSKLLNIHFFNPVVETVTVDPVSISNQVARRTVVGKGFDDLLSGPFCRWMFGHVEVYELATVVDQHHKDKQDSQPERWHCEEIHRDQVPDMIGQECLPRL